jgi:hypothetical protein
LVDRRQLLVDGDNGSCSTATTAAAQRQRRELLDGDGNNVSCSTATT